jgi:transposase
MDADREAIPNDIVALKEALAVERANALEITAESPASRKKFRNIVR